MEALPGKRNFFQQLGDGVKNFVHGMVMGLTPGAIPAQIHTEGNIYIQERREALQLRQIELSFLRDQYNRNFQDKMVKLKHQQSLEIQQFNQEFQEKLATLNHENRQKIEKYRADVQLAIQDKNINFQKWKLEQEKQLQLQIITLKQDFDRELARYNRETALNNIREQRRLANSPITLVSDDLLESPYRDATMPLRIFLSPPEINYDSFGQKSLGFKIENHLAESLRQFLDQHYPFNGQNRQTQLLDGAWISKKFRGGAGIQALHSQLKAVPTIVLESEVDGNNLNFRVAYWRGDGSEYTYNSILSGFPYRDFLYDSARDRAKEWAKIKAQLLAEEETEKEIQMIGGDNDFNLFLLQKEQKLLDKGIDISNLDSIQKDYKLNEKDFQKLHEYLILFHSVVTSVIADLHYLYLDNSLTPLLPNLLPELLAQFSNSDDFQKILLDWLIPTYNQMYESLEEVMSGWIPELMMQFAVALSNLEDKSYAKQQGEKSVNAWLRLHGIENSSRKALHSVVSKDDEPYFESLQYFIEKIGDSNGLTEIQRLVEDWLILNDLDVVQDSIKVNIDNNVIIEDVKSGLPGDKFSFEVVTVNSSGDVIKRETKTNRQQIFDLGNDILLEMVYIPGGSFIMGAPESEEKSYSHERPQHKVTLEPFWMAKYPVTQAQYKSIIGRNPCRFEADNNPVETVSHLDAVEFCLKLSVKLGKDFKLPSEAQWEYACRAGTTTPFYCGENITEYLVNTRINSQIVKEKQVGLFPPNAFGLFDMQGSVQEWCSDHFWANYNDAPNDGSAWISPPTNNNYVLTYVLRGGVPSSLPDCCRSAIRGRINPMSRFKTIGFRIVHNIRKTT